MYLRFKRYSRNVIGKWRTVLNFVSAVCRIISTAKTVVVIIIIITIITIIIIRARLKFWHYVKSASGFPGAWRPSELDYTSCRQGKKYNNNNISATPSMISRTKWFRMINTPLCTYPYYMWMAIDGEGLLKFAFFFYFVRARMRACVCVCARVSFCVFVKMYGKPERSGEHYYMATCSFILYNNNNTYYIPLTRAFGV